MTVPRHWHPRWWPTALAIALLRVLCMLPLPLLRVASYAIGTLLFVVHAPRRRIVAINLALCFPRWSRARRTRVGWQHFVALAQGVFDVGIAWWASPRRLRRLVRVTDDHHLAQARAGGRGVILLAPHFVAMEVGGMALSLRHSGATMFKDTKNVFINHLFRTRRRRFGGVLLEQRAGLKPAVRAIRTGNLFYYLPDQDVGGARSVFAPFFSVPTATVPALGRLARLGAAAVVPCAVRQLRWGRGYELRLYPALSDFPNGDDQRDAACMNQAIETLVRAAPAQYFWVHKRFKTRPPGAAKIY